MLLQMKEKRHSSNHTFFQDSSDFVIMGEGSRSYSALVFNLVSLLDEHKILFTWGIANKLTPTCDSIIYMYQFRESKLILTS